VVAEDDDVLGRLPTSTESSENPTSFFDEDLVVSTKNRVVEVQRGKMAMVYEGNYIPFQNSHLRITVKAADDG
jgi:hypothetical protein